MKVSFREDILKREWSKSDGTTTVSRAWYGRMRQPGARWQWVKLYNDKRASHRKWEALKQQAEYRAAGVLTDDIERLARPLTELVAEYHAGLRAQRCTPDHVTISEQMFARMLVLTKWRRFADITLGSSLDLLATLEQAGAVASYRNKFIMRLKAFVNATLPESWPDPLRKLRRVRERGARQTRARRAASHADLGALLSLPKAKRRRLAYALAAYNGLRRNEVESLRWTDIIVMHGITTVAVRQKMGSDESRDVIPVHPYVKSLLPDQPASGEFILATVPDVKTLRKDWERAGVAFADSQGRRLDYHALRHTFASALDRAGAGRTTKKRLMRHLSGDVTDGYSHAELRELADAIARIPVPAQMQSVSGSCPVPEKRSGIQGVFVNSGESTWVSGQAEQHFSGVGSFLQLGSAESCQAVVLRAFGNDAAGGSTGGLDPDSEPVSAKKRHAGGVPCPVRVRFAQTGRIRSFPPGGAAAAIRAAGYRVVSKRSRRIGGGR